MSSRNTYGKSVRRYGAKLQKAVEFSPTKRNNLDSQTTPSSDTLESENIPLTSLLSSPRRLKKGKSSNEEDDFDFGVFDLEEDEPKPAAPKKINRTRSKPLKPVKSFRSVKKTDDKDADSQESQGSQLSNFFIESSVKPSWSPSRSVTSSPVKNQERLKTPSPGLVKDLKRTKEESKSPIKPVRVADESKAADAWDFLSELAEDEGPKKKTMKLDIEEREPSDSSHPQEDNGILESLESQQFDTQDDNEPSTPVLDTQSSTSSQNTNSMKFPKARKGYGLQRSFLLEKQDDDKSADLDEGADITINSDAGAERAEGLHSINNLRAQGENAQHIDELNFMLEGLNSKSASSSLIELAIRLFDDSFSQFVKHHGLQNLQDSINIDNQLQLFTFGFILCKITEDGNGGVEFDSKLVDAVAKLLQNPDTIDTKKENRMTRSAFDDLKGHLDTNYSSRFFALTLLIQNGPFMSDEVLPHLIKTLNILSQEPRIDTKMINMSLILLERYLSSQEEVNDQFSEVIDNIFILNEKTDDCKVPALKLLIVLSAKNFKPVFSTDLVNISITNCLQKSNTPVGLLELGLLINLVENEACAKKSIDRFNIKKLYKLQGHLNGEHRHYYSLLVGILITKYPDQLRKAFDKDEITDIKHQLEAFEAKGNKMINLQVREILSKIKDI